MVKAVAAVKEKRMTQRTASKFYKVPNALYKIVSMEKLSWVNAQGVPLNFFTHVKEIRILT